MKEYQFMNKNQGEKIDSIYQDALNHDLMKVLSTERFNRYSQWAEGDKTQALRLYALNTALSEALYTPLQMLEIALRNRIHTILSEAYSPDWFNNTDLLTTRYQQETH